VEVWQTSNLRQLRLGKEKKERRKKNKRQDENIMVCPMCADKYLRMKLECGPMPNVMAALPNIPGALCSTPQSLAVAHYQSAVQ